MTTIKHATALAAILALTSPVWASEPGEYGDFLPANGPVDVRNTTNTDASRRNTNIATDARQNTNTNTATDARKITKTNTNTATDARTNTVQTRRESGTASAAAGPSTANAGPSTASTGPVQSNPIINLTLQNNSPVTVTNPLTMNSTNSNPLNMQSTNTNPVTAYSSNQNQNTAQSLSQSQSVANASQTGLAPSPAFGIIPGFVPSGVRSGCFPGVIGNLGIDPYGRPIMLNVRSGPGVQFPNVPGPNFEPTILPPGVRVAVCGQQSTWLQIEVCSSVSCVRGWTFNRYVLKI